MIRKTLHHDINVNNLERVRLISEKRNALDQASSQIQEEIVHVFKRLEDTLKARERRLIRQVEAVHRQQLSLIQSNLELLPSIPLLTLNLSKECELKEQILNFGRIELSDNCIAVNDSEPYKVVDYQEAHKDHINFDKSLQSEYTDLHKKRDLCLKTPLKLNIFNVPKNTNILKIENEPSCAKNFETDQPDGSDLDRFTCLSNSEEELVASDLSSENLNKSTKISTAKENAQNELLKSEESDLYTDEHCVFETIDLRDEDFKISQISMKSQDLSMNGSEHPKQIQQWLQQILVETETEPVVHEIGHFSGISKSEMRTNFPLET